MLFVSFVRSLSLCVKPNVQMLYFLALLAGIALAFSQPPSRRHWLQLVAFVPLLWALSQSHSLLVSIALGAIFGVSYAAITLWMLKLPLLVSGALVLSQTLTWLLFGAFCFRIQTLQPVWNALATGAGATFLVWLETQLVPLWGSAQSFARGWSHAPRLVQWVCYTGAIGVVFVVVGLQSLGVAASRALVSQPTTAQLLTTQLTTAQLTTAQSTTANSPATLLLTLICLLLGLWAISELLWSQVSARTMRVSTIGWAGAQFDDISLEKLEPHIRAATSRGARVIVTPEAAFRVSNRDVWRAQIGALAARYRVWLALGYFDSQRNINCIDWVAPDGTVHARYLKTHLVPVYETYNRGSGARAELEIDEIKVGGVICQDDNFSDIARGYGRDGVQLMTIPTNDWRNVQHFHLTSTLWRALEMRTAIARATSDGVSVLVSARGEVVARADHFDIGFETLIAELPLGSGRATIYAKWGDWFPLSCGVAALVATLWKL